MEDKDLISQKDAAAMLRSRGMSRRAAYYRLETMPHRLVVGMKVFTRADVEAQCVESTRGTN